MDFQPTVHLVRGSKGYRLSLTIVYTYEATADVDDAARPPQGEGEK